MSSLNTNASSPMASHVIKHSGRKISSASEKLLSGLGDNSTSGDVVEFSRSSNTRSKVKRMEQVKLRPWLTNAGWHEDSGSDDLNSNNANVDYFDVASVVNRLDSVIGRAVLTLNDDQVTSEQLASRFASGGDLDNSFVPTAASNGEFVQRDRAISTAMTERTIGGSLINRLKHTHSILLNSAQIISARKSQIDVADLVAESSELTTINDVSETLLQHLVKKISPGYHFLDFCKGKFN